MIDHGYHGFFSESCESWCCFLAFKKPINNFMTAIMNHYTPRSLNSDNIKQHQKIINSTFFVNHSQSKSKLGHHEFWLLFNSWGRSCMFAGASSDAGYYWTESWGVFFDSEIWKTWITLNNTIFMNMIININQYKILTSPLD